LDTTEKEFAWSNLITLLDSQDEVQYPYNIKEIVDEMFGKYNDRKWLELSEKAKSVTDKILERTSEPSDFVKSEMKVKLEEYEKTPQNQSFLEFQKFTKDNLAPLFKEVDQYVAILSRRFEKFNKILHKDAQL